MTEPGRRDEAWTRASDAFERALDLPEPERRAWIERALADDEAARRIALDMLWAHGRQGILDGPPAAEAFGEELAPPVEDHLRAALAGRYEIETALGEGGMASVFLAREHKHDRQVVIKVLRPEIAMWLGARRFLAEIHIVAQLSHPHILGLIDSGEAGDLLYYVMPHLGGETLRDRLRRGPLDVAEARTLLRDIVDALAYAHRHGIVHRDIKPENVLCVGGHAYLMDFGVAKIRSEVAGATRTLEGLAVGTPRYMSPEQADGGEVDHRTDLYSWGLVAREALTGRLHANGGWADHPGIPKRFARLIDRCVAVDPGTRPQSAATLLAELERFEDGAPEPDRRRWLARAWPVLAIGSAGVAAALLINDDGPPALDSLPLPVAVGAFQNETGDSTLGAWGRLAGDWISQGLQETERVRVVPWPVALQATERYERMRRAGEAATLAAVLRQDTNAGTAVVGRYYLIGSELAFQVELFDARTGASLGSLPQVRAPLDSAHVAVRGVRDRLMGAMAVRTDERLATLPGLSERPPTYEAYVTFDRGLSQYNAQSYRLAGETLLESWHQDTTFMQPLVFAARAILNTGDFHRADSLVGEIRRRTGVITGYLDLELQFLEASLAGDGEAALRAIREAAALAPGTRSAYNHALVAISLNRPAEAVEALRTIDPDHGALQGWAPYWYNLSHALHMLGRQEEELAVARELRKRFPESRPAWVHEARALAALGRRAELDSVLAEASTLPPDTYWSQGAAMVSAAEELEAHGNARLAPRYYAQAVSWLASQLARVPSHQAHRYWLGSALYDQGQWEDAAPYFESLTRDYPNDMQFKGLWAMIAAREGDTATASRRLGPTPRFEQGEHTAFRARIAAVGGSPVAAVDLLTEALRQGVAGLVWLHASARRDLELFAEDPRFGRLRLVP